MKTIHHPADSRGNANHGWLKSRHSFSFANYYDPERMGFGVLRVINDDFVIGGQGFGRHSHRDMEIISIPLSGKLAHADSMGNKGVIKTGDIQVMSAGTGITHSEMNDSQEEAVRFLQIWILPKEKSVAPRYQQTAMQGLMQPNRFAQVLSPKVDHQNIDDQNVNNQGVWIHQDAWFSIGQFETGVTERYQLNNPDNGVYVFVIEGNVTIAGNILSTRDGLGIWDTEDFSMDVEERATVLLMEVPFYE